MPELPEVETIVRGIRPLVTGRRILDAEFRTLDAAGSPPPAIRRILPDSAQEFQNALRGASIEQVRRYGKNILFELRPAGGERPPGFLLIHLGMTGRLTCENTPEFRSEHTHLVLSLDEPGRWLHYTDIRQFGRLRLLRPSAEELSRLGPDPLEISFPEFFRLLRARREMVKSLLLDQRFLRGLGNIYADESLFQARIHPTALASRLTREQARRLHRGIRETLRQAIAFGGSSISNYVDAQGRPGRFQRLHRVYRRTGQPCLRCGCGIQKILVASRSTHFCPRCQRAGRRSSRRIEFARKEGRVKPNQSRDRKGAVSWPMESSRKKGA